MNATLTLDADVAALLERIREERGRSLEELGNELLRRTLRQLGASSEESASAPAKTAQAANSRQWLKRVRHRKSAAGVRLSPAEILRHRDSDRR